MSKNNKIPPKIGFVYLLKDHNCPKVFDAWRFKCLMTDQELSPFTEIIECLGSLAEYQGEIWKPERFITDSYEAEIMDIDTRNNLDLTRIHFLRDKSIQSLQFVIKHSPKPELVEKAKQIVKINIEFKKRLENERHTTN